MEVCPRCGYLLEIVECCGGGVWKCEKCGEFYYQGEIIRETPPSEDEGASDE